MKKLVLAMIAGIAMLNCGLAHADSVTAYISGDNNISYWDGSSWVGAGNDWTNSETYTINAHHLSSPTYIAVSNDFTQSGSIYDGGNNPAGFAASFTDNNGTFVATGTNTLLSNTANFQVVAVSPWITNPSVFPTIDPINSILPTVDPTTLTGWTTPTSYGINTIGDSVWANANGGSVGNIDPNAEWLWTANNSGSYATMDDYAIFEFNLGVTDGDSNNGGGDTVPEPPTVLLFAFAGALVVFFNRRRLAL
jgi:hypothetical protein